MFILFFFVPFKESVRVLMGCFMLHIYNLYNFKQDLRKITHTSIVHFLYFVLKVMNNLPSKQTWLIDTFT